MKEIKIFRTEVSSVTEALKWSDDGQLAVNSCQYATILTPSMGTDEPDDEAYTQRQTPALDQGVNLIENDYGYYYDEKFSQTAYVTENCITDLIWSPTGSSARRGCLLAMLTTRGHVVVYEPLGNPSFAEWHQKHNLNTQLIDERKIQFPIRQTDATDLRFHSLEWTRVYPWAGSKWGTSFVLVGTESNKLVLFQHDDEGMRYFAEWGAGMAAKWITQLSMSDQTAEHKSILALASSDNDLAVKKVYYDSEGMQLVCGDHIGLIGPSRFRISALRWWTSQDTDKEQISVLAVFRMAYLHIFVFENMELKHKGLKVFSTWQKECTGIVIYPENNGLKVVATSCQGDVLAAEYDGREFVHTTESTITNFVSQRRDLSVDDDVEFDLRPYSATPHPHGTYMAVVYSVYQAQKFRYPVMSENVRRVAFLPTTKGNNQLKFWSVMSGSALSSWWEINALIKTLLHKSERQQAKSEFLERLAHELDSEGLEGVKTRPASDNLGQDLEAVLLANPQMDRIRLLQHYGHDHHLTVLKALATTTLKFVHKLGDLELTGIDRAILQAYSHFVDDPKLAFSTEDGTTGPITISGGFFQEEFDFTKPYSETTITSNSDHAWPRCSITLLPLLSVNVLTCNGCGKKAVHQSTLPENPGNLTEVILDTLDVCIYCGGRFYERNK